MAFQPLSVGDVIMMSQQAWKIGRAFTQGRNSAPAEFAEVEREANSLSDGLKITAETLHADESILSRAEPETRAAVYSILESAGTTLGDMESFVERYQVIKKRQTGGSGFVVEKSWSDVILANYKILKWTTEGGSLQDLRNMLQMHTNTINLTMQALQSRSLARLEKAVIPIAENINSIHDRVNGDLGDKIDDLHRIIMAVANSTPSLVAKDRDLGDDHQHLRSISNGSIPTLETGYGDGQRLIEAPPPRSSSFAPVRQSARPDRTPRDSVQSTPVVGHRPRKSDGVRTSSMDWDFENGSLSTARRSIGDSVQDRAYAEAGAVRPSPTSPTKSSREFSLPRRESSTLPTYFRTISEDDPGTDDNRDMAARQRSYEDQFSPISESRSESWRSSGGQPVLPPPAIPPSSQRSPPPATPSSFLSQVSRLRNDSTEINRLSRPQTAKSVREEQPKSTALLSLPAFEKSLFRNAAILCDVRGTLVEFARTNPDEPDERYQTEMVEACKEARICVIRKRENREHGGTRLATSIWVLSEDGIVRCQQKLSEVSDTVPFCSYFQPEKVSLADGEMVLRFHGQAWMDMPEKDIKSNWINYIFATENDASAFQSAVYGRMLIGSFRTTKTIVIHQGLKGAFAFEEQFANIETLRLWEDDGVTTPGAQGGVMALMHISSNFGEGWAKWWMNSTKQQVRIKGEGSKYARLKGIDITVVKPGTGVSTADKIRHNSSATMALQRVDTKDSLSGPQVPMKNIPVKRVTGIKIEFKSDEERTRFVDASQRAQQKMLSLPDL